eukprot:scaffold676771_cov122-Prasinocladus_malaysianus.AAC.2
MTMPSLALSTLGPSGLGCSASNRLLCRRLFLGGSQCYHLYYYFGLFDQCVDSLGKSQINAAVYDLRMLSICPQHF